MKILLLNQVFYPDAVATAQYLTDLAAELSAQGHEVTVISGRRAYEHPETIYPAREIWRGVRIIRIFSTRFGKGAKWRRAADFASFLFFLLRPVVIPPAPRCGDRSDHAALDLVLGRVPGQIKAREILLLGHGFQSG